MRASAKRGPAPILEVTLTLSLQDAMALRTIVGAIGGNPKENPGRAFTDRLWGALNEVGIRAFATDSIWDTPNGVVKFSDTFDPEAHSIT